ncbi:vitellogenin [Bombus fervidus]|uniref:vitellogenin n=1 Tax=Bombus fervidus TaxID=203811 RepID=UPI003AB25C9E
MSTAFNMWLLLTVLLLAGIVSADYDHGWHVGNEYTYLIRSRTIASLNELSDLHTGILIKALLTIQVKDPQMLTAKVSQSQYARVFKSLPEGWDTEISDQLLELRDLPLSGKPFCIKLKHGVIRDILVDRTVPTWEVNILKSIVSQLQIDSLGENAIRTDETQIPTDQEPYGLFRVMEDSVGGQCEVLYDITPLPEHVTYIYPELLPIPKLKGDGQYIDIRKSKNYNKCDRRMNYQFGITDNKYWEAGSNKNGKFFSQSATSRIIISGTLKSFTIQSAVTTNLMYVNPRFYDHGHGLVASRMNLTLAAVKKITNPLLKPKNLESTGNLVYTYHNPFSDIEERRVGKVLEDSDKTMVSDSVSSVSSSEEVTKGQNLRSLSSDSSSSSSSISSSEEDQYWQPKPTMENAPQNPLSPLLIGYNGKYIGKHKEMDVVAKSRELIYQIANEMEDPNDLHKNQILEKYTILSDLLRTMNKDQILQVDKDVHFSPHELKSLDKTLIPKQNAWNVLKSAVAQTGTGPGLLVIKNWIELKEVDSTAAADLLARLPKTARAPTAEYVKEFFKLATCETVMKDLAISGPAIIAFSELVYNAQVSRKSLHNHYPVHTFGRLTPKHDQVVTREYIPYLEKELKKAVESGRSTVIQTYIVALGNIGHPKILPVLEPYLEGKVQLTVFQRTLVVSALAKLAEGFPKLARSILYKIYLNTMEAHQVRCTAVFLLMTTDPPLLMLQRMAEFTKIEKNKHVNSAVKSTLKSLANMKDPEYRTLAKKARAAKNLLTPNEYSYHYSHGYATESITDGGNIISHMILDYIGSDDSLVPNAIYYAVYSSYGDFKLPPFEVVAMVSSIRSILELNTSQKDKEGIRLAAERIAEELNIIPDKPIPLEGNINLNGKYIARFLPFDKTSLSLLRELLTMYLKGEKQGNLINRLQSYDVTFGFPTETGLPFVYSFEIPTLFKITGAINNEAKNAKITKAGTDVRMLYAMKIQGRLGFVTPFEYQQYIVGVDLNFNVYLPMKITLDMDLFKHKWEIRIYPLKGEEKARLLHYSVVPYIANHNILNLRPLLTEKTTQTLLSNDINSDTISGWDLVNMYLESDKSYNYNNWVNMDFDDFSDVIMTPWTLDYDYYQKVDILLNLKREQVAPFVFNITYDFMDFEPTTLDTTLWTYKATAVEPSDKEADSETRRKQWMEEAANGIKLAKSQVIDILIEIPVTSEESIQNVITIAKSYSEAEKKGRTLLYWSFNKMFEVCATTQTKVTPDNTVFYDQVAQLKPKVEFNADLRIGRTCSTGEQININSEATQSKELRERIKNVSLIKTCQKQMYQGNNILRACQNAAAISMILDQMTVSIDFQSPYILYYTTKALAFVINADYLKEYADIHTHLLDPKVNGKKKIDIAVNLTDNLERADILIATPIMNIRINHLDLSVLEISAEDVLMAADEDMDIQNLLYNEDEPACILDNTRAQTFDGKEYPLRLGNCWHVVMTTYPQANPDNPDEKMYMYKFDSVSILIRETENGQREVKVLLGDKEIKFVPTSTEIQVLVNEHPVTVTKDISWQERKDNEVLYEIFQIDEHFIGLVSDKYALSLVYDGKRVMIKAGDKFRKVIRGLCGNYDGEPVNDFTAPRSCILRKPELFIASYALTKEHCEGESLENSKLLMNYDCVQEEKSRFSNVISDKESGRKDTEESNWGYHKQVTNKHCTILKTNIEETDNAICFTIRQVPFCAPGCWATETKPKDYQYHCMKKDRAALALKNRINKGAKPDLSQKSVTYTEPINVPLACKA